jgi:hypothetical protein
MTVKFRVEGDALEQPWEGDLDELLEANPGLPELVERRLETLAVGETVRPPLGDDTFVVTRVS